MTFGLWYLDFDSRAGFGVQARGRQSRLNSRMAGTDDNDIVEFGEKKLFHVESDQLSSPSNLLVSPYRRASNYLSTSFLLSSSRAAMEARSSASRNSRSDIRPSKARTTRESNSPAPHVQYSITRG